MQIQIRNKELKWDEILQSVLPIQIPSSQGKHRETLCDLLGEVQHKNLRKRSENLWSKVQRKTDLEGKVEEMI